MGGTRKWRHSIKVLVDVPRAAPLTSLGPTYSAAVHSGVLLGEVLWECVLGKFYCRRPLEMLALFYGCKLRWVPLGGFEWEFVCFM